MKQQTLIQKKLKTQEITQTQEKKKKRARVLKILLFLIGGVAVIAATSPFWHIFFSKSDRVKFINFTNVRRFLYSFGNHFALFGCSIFLLFVKNYIAEEFRAIKSFISVIGGLFLAISIYFLAWCFKPSSLYPNWVYEVSFVVAGLVSAIAAYNLSKISFKMFLEKRKNTRNFLSYIFEVRNEHYPNVAMRSLDVDEKETIEDIKKFEERTVEELEKIAEG